MTVMKERENLVWTHPFCVFLTFSTAYAVKRPSTLLKSPFKVMAYLIRKQPACSSESKDGSDVWS